eukprot:GFYU01000754.1.p1 GENE.GFYU01000754.1~~GFYU01000754.1.p1  ORF type:complete len:294 (+),score=75.79 GFYU01000754.1:81-962(+)
MGDANTTGVKKKTVFFDVDNTLYPHSAGIAKMMNERIINYFTDVVGIQPVEEASRVSYEYYKNYGLAVKGLKLHHGVDVPHYMAAVDGSLPLETALKPDPELRQMLLRMKEKCRLFLFTNGDRNHGTRVAQVLGVDDLFEGIQHISHDDLICKPTPCMYEGAMKIAGETDPTNCYFIDDSPANTLQGCNMGWTCVLVQEGDAFGDVHAKQAEEVMNEIKAGGRDESKASAAAAAITAAHHRADVIAHSHAIMGMTPREAHSVQPQKLDLTKGDKANYLIRVVHQLPIVCPELF